MKIATTASQYNNECRREVTSFPWFAIVKKYHGQLIVEKGIWLTRQEAEWFLRGNTQNYKDCFVFCFSGIGSDLERLEAE